MFENCSRETLTQGDAIKAKWVYAGVGGWCVGIITDLFDDGCNTIDGTGGRPRHIKFADCEIARLALAEPDPKCACGNLGTREHMDDVPLCDECGKGAEPASLIVNEAVKGFDLVKYIGDQKAWSERTFGPGKRTGGLIEHIQSELKEIRDAPTDLMEWVDVVILAFDGAWRAGWRPEYIVDALQKKQVKNFNRKWPEPGSEDKANYHIKEPVPAESAAAWKPGDPIRYGPRNRTGKYLCPDPLRPNMVICESEEGKYIAVMRYDLRPLPPEPPREWKVWDVVRTPQGNWFVRTDNNLWVSDDLTCSVDDKWPSIVNGAYLGNVAGLTTLYAKMKCRLEKERDKCESLHYGVTGAICADLLSDLEAYAQEAQ